jgi:hypothetical protein
MSDALDLANVRFHSSPDVRSWPVTSQITELRLRPGTLHLRHTREVEWPDVPYETTTQESTLWVFVQIDGQWHATGAERIRPNQFDKPEPDRVSQWIKEWLYNAQMWGPMANYVPAPGELVGFMLTAGIQRAGDASIVKERSNVVLVQYPDDRGADYPPFATLQPPRQPEPVAPPPVDPSPAPVAASAPPAVAVGRTNETATAGAVFVVLAKLEAIHDAIVKQAEQQHKDAEALRELLEHFVGR